MLFHFPFHRIFALIIVFAILAVPGSAAWTAQNAPGLPGNPQPAPNGMTLLPEQQVSSPISPSDPKRYVPQSAYDSENQRYLVVWHQTYESGHTREVYGQLVGADGKRIGSQFKISSGANDAVQPAVAYNSVDHEFMVLFMYDVNGFGYVYNINGRRVSASGSLLGSEMIIQQYVDTTFWSPKIAYNKNWNEYMAVWVSANVNPPQISNGIGMRMLDNLGNSLYGTILTGDGYPSDPDVVCDPINDHYMVVWDYVNTSGKNAIVGDLRDNLGNRIKLVSVISSTTNNAFTPRVASGFGFGAGWFYVTFEYEIAPNDHDIYLALTNSLGTIDPMFYGNVVPGTTNDTHPDIAGYGDTSQMAIVFQRADVMGAKIMMVPFSTNWPAEPTEICSYFGGDCETPSITYSGSSFLIAYAEEYLTSSLIGEAPEAPVKLRHIFNRVFNLKALFLPVIKK